MNNQTIGRKHFERAMEAATKESRALSLYNAMGLLIGFDNVEESLLESMAPNSVERYLTYVLNLANQGDTQDAYPSLIPTQEDLDGVIGVLHGILED